MTPRIDPIPAHVRAAIGAAQDKQAEDIVLLNLEGLGAFTDYFLICTGFSTPQLSAICDAVEEKLERLGHRRARREGKSGNDWMLLDFGSLIVHVFTERARHFYDLERLWRVARRVEFGESRTGKSLGGAAEAEG